MCVLVIFFLVKEEKQQQKHIATWVVTCADGSYGGSFTCNCSQGQANAIAHIMC